MEGCSFLGAFGKRTDPLDVGGLGGSSGLPRDFSIQNLRSTEAEGKVESFVEIKEEATELMQNEPNFRDGSDEFGRMKCFKSSLKSREDAKKGHTPFSPVITPLREDRWIERVEIKDNCRIGHWLIDTGSVVTIVKNSIAPRKARFPCVRQLQSVTGDALNVYGEDDLTLVVAGVESQVRCVIADLNGNFDGILGIDFLIREKFILNCGRKLLLREFYERSVPTNSGRSVEEVSDSSSSVVFELEKTLCPVELKEVASQAREKSDEDSFEGSGYGQVLKEEGMDTVKFDQSWEENSGCKRSGGDEWKLEDEGLTDLEVTNIKLVWQEFSDVFSKAQFDPGRAAGVQHRIVTGDQGPLRRGPYRVPFSKREIMLAELKSMVAAGVVERSDSPWSSGIVLVPKKNGEVRFCVDYRPLNSITRKDAHPLPHIQDIVQTCAGAKWYCSLDLKSGYWQIPVHPKDREKTAFAVPGGGLWQFKVMPFGLTNAVATFQRYMEYVLEPLVGKGVFVYVDDIIVMGSSVEELVTKLREVMTLLQKFNLRVNAKKCVWFKREMKFLGHLVGENGVRADPDKIRAVNDWPLPKCVSELKSFLGLATYYRRFVRDFSRIAGPLHQLTKLKVGFEWSNGALESFQKLKEVLTMVPVLDKPVNGVGFILDVDASGTGIGAVLSQMILGQEKVVEYYSRSLSDAERNYCITRLELLGLVSAVKHFHHYLCGVSVRVRTDHSSLTWLRSFHRVEGQLARWMETLALYDLEIIHRPGRIHGNADALSRKICGRQCPFCRGLGQGRIKAEVVNVNDRDTKEVEVAATEIKVESLDWKAEQEKDETLQIVKTWLTSGKRPGWDEVSGSNRLLKALWNQFESLVVTKGVITRKACLLDGSEIYQVVVPISSIKNVLELTHGGQFHLGIVRAWDFVKARFYWPGWRSDVETHIHSCLKCLQTVGPPTRQRQVLKSFPSGYPWQRIAIDFYGPLPRSEQGERFVLVIMDYFSKWVECFPTINMEAETVARVLIKEVFSRYGIPLEIHSDQGRSFENEVMRQLCDVLGILKTRTTPYRPQSDGMVERFMRTLKEYMTKLLVGSQANWVETLPWILLALRATKQTVTGFSPALVFLGREIRIPVDLILGQPESKIVPINGYLQATKECLERVYNLIRHRISKSQETFRYEGRAPKIKELRVGEKVLVFDPSRRKGRSPKLCGKWKGPGEVLNKISDWVYRVRLRGKVIVRHRNHLASLEGCK